MFIVRMYHSGDCYLQDNCTANTCTPGSAKQYPSVALAVEAIREYREFWAKNGRQPALMADMHVRDADTLSVVWADSDAVSRSSTQFTAVQPQAGECSMNPFRVFVYEVFPPKSGEKEADPKVLIPEHIRFAENESRLRESLMVNDIGATKPTELINVRVVIQPMSGTRLYNC